MKGFRFKRQHPVGGYIADFYCHKAKLIIELDGEYHGVHQQATLDDIRTSVLNKSGLKVLRFSDQQVNTDLKHVLQTIEDAVQNEGPL